MNISLRITIFLLCALASINCNKEATVQTQIQTQIQAAPIDLTEGLIAHYPFEGTIRDTSVNAKHGTAFGTFAFVSGKHGQGIRLVGDNTNFHTTGGYIQIPPIDTTGLNELSISLWVKEDSNSVGDGYIFLSSDYEQGWCGIGHFGNFLQFAVGATKTSISPATISFDSTAFGQWTLYTLVYSQGNVSMYKNGQLITLWQQQLRIYGNLITLGSHIWGGSNAGFTTHFSGIIDEVRLYKRALTVGEVQLLYQSGL